MCKVVSVFSDINISRGSVATRLRCGRTFYYRFFQKFTAKSVGEKKMKIGYYLAKLERIKIELFYFSGHGV